MPKRRNMKKLAIPLLLILIAGIAVGQTTGWNEQGFPFIRNFPATEYRAHAQNFAIVRHPSGMVYAGNFAGVLQYDGTRWRLITTARTTRVSALGVDASGKVFVGALGEAGCLEADSRGELFFRSLIDTTGPVPAFQEVLQVLPASDGVWFITRKVLMRWNSGKMEMWQPEEDVMSGFYVNQTLYLQVRDKGLVKFRNGVVEPVVNGERVAGGAIEMKAMLPYPGGRALVATGTQGFYLLDNDGLAKFSTPSDGFLMENFINSAVVLSDGTYAVGTSRRGVVILAPDGSRKQLIDRRASLRDEYVRGLFADSGNVLWAALNNGISMIEAPSALSFFDEKSGLGGAVIQMLRHRGRLYAATYQGLFVYAGQETGFQAVPGIIAACWNIVPFGNDLLAATSQGVFQVTGDKARRIREGFALSLTVSANDPGLVYGSETGRFWSMKQSGGAWKSREIAASDDEIRKLMEDSEGNIWGTTLTKGLFRYRPTEDKMEYFTGGSGLPEAGGSAVTLIAGRVCVSTRSGVFRFDPAAGTFSPLAITKQDSAAAAPWYSIIREAQGNLWVNAGDETHLELLKKSGDLWEPYRMPFLPIADYVIWDIFPEPDGVTWFGGPDGLIRYNPAVNTLRPEPQPTLIRQINTGDSLLYAGNHNGDSNPLAKPGIFRYQNNSVSFAFTLPFCAARGENQYQYILEGFEDTWSDWTGSTLKEYTNLPKGKYTFHVRSRNVYGITTAGTDYRFAILSPWYSTIWAIILYILLVGGTIYLIVIIRNRQLIREKRVLEQRIAERTAEVVQQKEEIEKQSEELADKNDELEKINTAVKSINSEIKFENLLQSLLEKMKVIKSVEKSTALVYDKNENVFRYKASIGWDVQQLALSRMTLEQAEERYIKDAREIYEDIFLKTDFTNWVPLNIPNAPAAAKTLLVVVIRIENRVDAFLILQNMVRENAFEARDLSFIRNSKEHIISAFIRTRILEDLELTLKNLKEAQDQLVQSEKLASLGALIAGIAHEIQNPLNFVNNFSSLSGDLTDELLETLAEIREAIPADKYADMEEVTNMLKGNVGKIHEHGKRAESIVKGMLQHSRGRSGEFEQVNINNMVSEYVNLAYHGMRAKDKNFNTAIRTNLDPEVGTAAIIPQDLSRVVLNIVNNACYALDEKVKKNIAGFSPEVTVSTKKVKNMIEIRIRDNGTGIPPHVREKIFNPFFTTKPAGQGTGLGLSLSFDIVTQIHKGKLEVESKDGEFTEFIITIPEKQS